MTMIQGPFPSYPERPQDPEREAITLRDIGRFMRRHALWLAGSTLLGVAVAILYVANTTPTYRAVARLVMDPGQQKIASRDTSTGTIIIEAAEIASQLEIVKSEAVARAVIAELDLLDDPELRSKPSWRSRVFNALDAGLVAVGLRESDATGPISGDLALRQTMARFLGRISVQRVGQSYVLEIGYTSADPERAALTANTVAQTYIRNGMEQQSRVASSGAKWLEERLFETGRQAREAQLEEENYRLKTGITAIGDASTLEEQQLVETARQLLEAKSQTATQRARLDAVTRILAEDRPDLAIDSDTGDGRTGRLRDEISKTTARLDLLVQRYGPGNPAIVAAQADLDRLAVEMRHALLRLASSYRSDLAIAEGKERLMEAELVRLKARNAETDLASAKLAELQSRSATYRRMYENMLERLIGAMEKQTFPLGYARVVTAASRPLNKSSPKTSLIVPMAALLGLVAGLVGAALRETMDRRLLPGHRLQRAMGLGTLGILPRTPQRTGTPVPNPFKPGDARHLQWAQTHMLGAVVNTPEGAFSAALRDVRMRLGGRVGGGERHPVVGVASLHASDNARVVAVNLAQIYLNENIDTVLMDAYPPGQTLEGLDVDIAAAYRLGTLAATERRSVTASTLAGKDKALRLGGLQAPLLARLAEGIMLPVEMARRGDDAGHLFGHLPRIALRLKNLVAEGKLVIVDIPPLLDSADARALCEQVDIVILVTQHPSSMSLDAFAKGLDVLGAARGRIAGVVFNEVAAAGLRPAALALIAAIPVGQPASAAIESGQANA